MVLFELVSLSATCLIKLSKVQIFKLFQQKTGESEMKRDYIYTARYTSAKTPKVLNFKKG